MLLIWWLKNGEKTDRYSLFFFEHLLYAFNAYTKKKAHTHWITCTNSWANRATICFYFACFCSSSSRKRKEKTNHFFFYIYFTENSKAKNKNEKQNDMIWINQCVYSFSQHRVIIIIIHHTVADDQRERDKNKNPTKRSSRKIVNAINDFSRVLLRTDSVCTTIHTSTVSVTVWIVSCAAHCLLACFAC